MSPKTSCFYCEKIHAHEPDYPMRVGSFTTDETVLRCAIHSQFQCAICRKFYHFSWLYWCQKQQKYICGNCNSPTLTPLTFWNTTYTYTFNCIDCGKSHYDLYYAEFQGNHPWQKKQDQYKGAIIGTTPEDIIWTPKKRREGKNISLSEAFIIPNSVLPLRRKSGTIKFHSPLTDQEDINSLEVQSQWEQTSQEWITLVEKLTENDQGDLNRQLIIDPDMWKLIGEVAGLTVLDAGCGNGYFSRALTRKGAQVTGVDQSKVLIEFCREKEKEQNLGIQYYVENLANLSDLADETFDLIISNIVFVDVLDYKEAFQELGRVLKPSGRFIWSNIHPIFGRIGNLFYRVPSDTPRNEERLYVMIDRYFDSGGTLISWGELNPIWQFDRTLSEYTAALKEGGFVIREIIEPKPTHDAIKKYPRLLAFDSDRIPFFIVFECLKLQ